MLFVNENTRLIDGAVSTVRLAIISIFRLVLLTNARCSLGSAGGASGGSAEEKDHSSSSFAAVAGAAGRALRESSDPSTAKGSSAVVFAGGGEKAGRAGWGVTDCEVGAEVKDENWEKELGGGVGTPAETGPFALLSCVTDDRSGPPGISVGMGQYWRGG